MAPACQPKSTSQSPEALAYKAIEVAFQSYDLGMTTLRSLQVNGIITPEQYQDLKDKYGWPFYRAIEAANNAVEVWRKAGGSDDGYAKVMTALQALSAAQKSFNNLVSVTKGVQK